MRRKMPETISYDICYYSAAEGSIIMTYLKQFLRILLISFLGELLHTLIPLPIPASIYGLAILLTGLITGLIPLANVREAGKFLVEIMPVMFIPAGVGLLESWGILKPVCVPVLVITLLSTILVMAVSGRVTQAVIRWEERRRS